jgi:DNA-binding NarL/FixJ family response regulator
MPGPIRVLMLEDSEPDAERMRDELHRAGVHTVTERVDSEDTFASALREFSPDIVLSDHSLSQFNGRAALELVRDVRPTVPLIIVTCSVHGDKAVAYMRAGGEDLIIKENLDRLAESVTEALHARRPLEKLSPRQLQVLRMVAEGQRTREIAARLKLSVKTVEAHRSAIMKRLEIHDLVGLVRYAMRVGLVT